MFLTRKLFHFLKNRAIKSFYSNGKLLLTGEYFVLDGAAGFAIPTRYGQSLRITEKSDDPQLDWQSFDEKNTCWFRGRLDLVGFKILDCSDQKVATTLAEILKACRDINPDFLPADRSYSCETKLNFPRSWGLGSSSTLINNIAQWAEVNPYRLLQATMGGSGYDIACAGSNRPLIYISNEFTPSITELDYRPAFADNLYFVYLENKQDSREGISRYRSVGKPKEAIIRELDVLANSFINAENIHQLNSVIKAHEKLIADFLQMECVKQRLFSDFQGEIKSLGAWGGDFVLVSSEQNRQETEDYFRKKGYRQLIPFNDMIIASRK